MLVPVPTNRQSQGDRQKEKASYSSYLFFVFNASKNTKDFKAKYELFLIKLIFMPRSPQTYPTAFFIKKDFILMPTAATQMCKCRNVEKFSGSVFFLTNTGCGPKNMSRYLKIKISTY